MGRKIGRVYGIDLDRAASKEMAKKNARIVGGYLGGSTVGNVLGTAAWFAGKLTPVGLVAVTAAQAGFASAATYVAGQAWKRYFRLRYLGAPEPDFQEIAQATARDLRRSILPRPRRSRHATAS